MLPHLEHAEVPFFAASFEPLFSEFQPSGLASGSQLIAKLDLASKIAGSFLGALFLRLL